MTPYEKFLVKARARFGDTFTYRDYVSGSHPKLVVTCPVHGDSEQYAASHLKGFGCSKCFADSKKYTLDYFMQKSCEVHGDKYLYIGISYVDRVAMISYLCPEHGYVYQRAGNHLKGRGCLHCGHEDRINSLADTLEEVLAKLPEDFKSQYSYGLISVEGANRYISYKCKHGEVKQLLESHLAGKKPKCCSIEASYREPDYQKFLDQFAIDTPEVEFTYIGRGLKHPAPRFQFDCPKHGKMVMDGYHLLKGYRCASCSKTSKPTEEIAEYIRSLGLSVEYEHLTPAHRGRYDIFVPEANLLIDYHGLYWHSSKFKPSTAHLYKQKAAESQGYTCIQIFEDEWRYRTTQVKTLIASRLGKLNYEKVSARGCSVVELTHEAASAFYEKTHIQGRCAPAKYFGLSLRGEVVAVAAFSFRLSSRKTSVATAELLRYASSKSVRGGLGKLQKAFLHQFPAVVEIVSFSDSRLFSGEVYRKLGYRVSGQLGPDYSYYDPKVSPLRQHKSKYQKSKLAKRFANVGDLSEKAITEANNIYRLYDAGKVRWSFYVVT